MSSRPQATVELSLSLSTNTLSLSQSDQAVTITVTATTLSSSNPSSGIVFNARWTVMDDCETTWLYPFRLRSVSDPPQFIRLRQQVFPSLVLPTEPDLRRNTLERFLVVPGVGQGSLTVEHTLTSSRIFQYSHLKPSAITPGAKYQFEVLVARPSSSLPPRWWAFEDETVGKRFRKGVTEEIGSRYGDSINAARRLMSEGWMYSHPTRDCKFVVKTDSPAVIQFTD
ncbi:hypothetical protein F5Y18DRAFT_81756 [Xylariaceae sp. FL1019]|nr:hypothetical protein F5Y18DRAFT_81756 [Xylariaceae sp. FL1019]